MNAKVAVLGFLRFPPERMVDIRPHLQNLVDATRQQDGCIAYDVAEDLFDRGLIRFSELWPDQETLARHMTTPHIDLWRAASRSCGLMGREFTAYDIAGARTF